MGNRQNLEELKSLAALLFAFFARVLSPYLQRPKFGLARLLKSRGPRPVPGRNKPLGRSAGVPTRSSALWILGQLKVGGPSTVCAFAAGGDTRAPIALQESLPFCFL